MEECRYGNGFLRLLVAHDGHANSAIRMASATELAPIRGWAMHQIREIGKCTQEADREPVTNWLADARLSLHVVRQVRKRVALRFAAFVGHGFVATRERNRLEREERNLFGIVKRKLNYVSYLLIVDAVHDGDYRNNVHTGAPQVLDSAQLHIKQIAHGAMRVR